MSNPVGTFQTYQAIGDREDLTDVIYNIDPVETPFMTSAQRSKATFTKHEWQKDALKSAVTSNQAVEGDTPGNTTVTPTTRLFNYTEIATYAFNISGTQQAVRPAGRADELAYQLVKYGKALKRDMESALTGKNCAAAGTSGAARVGASLESWMSTNWTTNASSPASAASPGFSSVGAVSPVDGSVASTVTAALVQAIIRQAWTAGGEPDIIMCGPYNKIKISAFAGILTNTIQQSAKGPATIIAAADAYQSDFGLLRVVPNRFSRDRTISILDMSYWAVAYLRPFQQFALAKVGDSDQRQVLAEYTLESRHEGASGKVADLATA
jgi:hypothetical protein